MRYVVTTFLATTIACTESCLLPRESPARRLLRLKYQLDNVRCHHASLHAEWRNQVNDHFELHFLPPYSPELNPIERVWKLIRRRCLHNQYFPNLEDVVAAITPSLRRWSRPNPTLARLCRLA
jgi:transposase